MHVDGVLVYGKVHDVSVADIREILADDSSKTYAALEVVGSNEIHAHLETKDLGWVPMRHDEVREPDGHKVLKWEPDGVSLPDNPAAMRLIRTAREVYVFPVTTPLEPRRDDKQMRLLGIKAREALVRLLGDKQSWLDGFDDTVMKPGADVPTNIGFLFRQGSSELVLFFTTGSRAEGSFNGEYTAGSVDSKPPMELEAWKNQYAKPELATK